MIHSKPYLKFFFCMSLHIYILDEGILKIGIIYSIQNSKKTNIDFTLLEEYTIQFTMNKLTNE